MNNASSTSDTTLLTETSHSTTDGAAIGSHSHQEHISSSMNEVHGSHSSQKTLASSPTHPTNINRPVHQVHVSHPTHEPTTNNCSHQVHMSSPTHQVHISSPIHHSSNEHPTPIDLTEVTSSTDSFTSDEKTSSSDQGHSEEEQPFCWENLSEVEDESATAMTEPQQCDYNPVEFSVPVSSHHHTSPPSLQDAFKQHKANFISNSQSRLQQIKEKRKEQSTMSSVMTTPPKPSSTSRVVQFSSPLYTLQDTGEFTPPIIHRANS